MLALESESKTSSKRTAIQVDLNSGFECCCESNSKVGVWDRTSQKETEGEEETQRAVCMQVWLEPHPVVIRDTCMCFVCA